MVRCKLKEYLYSDLKRLDSNASFLSGLKWYFIPKGSTYPYQVWLRINHSLRSNKLLKCKIGLLPYLKYCKMNKQFILFYVDIWPECLKVYIKSENNPIFKIFKKISKNIYSSADKVLCTSTSFIDYLNETHDISKEKLFYLPQFGDDSLLEEDFTPIDNGIIDLVFLGNVGQKQDLSSIIKALSQLKEENFIFHIVGDGSDLENVKKVTKELNMQDKVKFYGRRPKEEMRKYYKLADACVLPLRCNNKIGLTLPNKLQNYMAAGKPILGVISGSAKQVIEEANCGICIEGDDINKIAKVIQQFIVKKDEYFEYGVNSHKYYHENYTKEKVMSNLIERININ